MRFTPIYTTEDMRAKTANEKFEYELACNQLCGSAHYNMRRVVVVENQGAFDAWQKTFKPRFRQCYPRSGKTKRLIRKINQGKFKE